MIDDSEELVNHRNQDDQELFKLDILPFGKHPQSYIGCRKHQHRDGHVEHGPFIMLKQRTQCQQRCKDHISRLALFIQPGQPFLR